MYTREDFAYRWGVEKLLSELFVADRGARDEGNIFTRMHHENATYLYGVIVARMNNLTPPFEPGQKLRAIGETVFISYSNSDHCRGIRGQRRKFSGIVTIERIYYVWKTRKWEIVFVEKTPETTFTVIPGQDIPLRFMAEDFTIDVQLVLQA